MVLGDLEQAEDLEAGRVCDLEVALVALEDEVLAVPGQRADFEDGVVELVLERALEVDAVGLDALGVDFLDLGLVGLGVELEVLGCIRRAYRLRRLRLR